jgi:beta-exotoxin I transport system permease protein
MMIVASRFERDQRRSNLAWGAGILAVIAATAAFWPSIEGTASLDEVIDDLPATLQSLIGAQGGVSLGSPAGYLNARLFATVLPALLMVYGIGRGARALAGSEEDGTLELILANPVSRSRVAAERGLAAFGSVVALGVVALVALLALGGPVGLLDGVSVVRLFAACGGLTVLAAFHTALAFAVGAATGRHGLAVAIAATVAVAGYLLAGLLATSAELRWLRVISPWEWLLARNVLVQGTPVLPLLIEIVIGVALVAAGAQRFTRRDLR